MVQVSIIQTIKKIKKNIFQISWLQWSEYLLWKLSNIIRFFRLPLETSITILWWFCMYDVCKSPILLLDFIGIQNGFLLCILFPYYFLYFILIRDIQYPAGKSALVGWGGEIGNMSVCLSEWVSKIASKLQTIFFLLVLFSTEKWTEKIKPRFSNN